MKEPLFGRPCDLVLLTKSRREQLMRKKVLVEQASSLRDTRVSVPESDIKIEESHILLLEQH
jgi:hypothetical protein